MSRGRPKRHYLVFDFPGEAWDEKELRKREVSRFLGEQPALRGHKAARKWEFNPSDEKSRLSPLRKPRELHSLLLVEDELPNLNKACDDKAQRLSRVAIDFRLRRTDYWNPATATRSLFGNRSAAHRLMELPRPDEIEQDHNNVNIVIIDQGIDRAEVEARRGQFAGGWQSASGRGPGATKGGHGSMLVRNILSVAPGATIFDLPLIPPVFSDIPAFLSDAQDAFEQMLVTINQLRETKNPRWEPPWVILNAWAVFNNGGEYTTFPGTQYNYTNNPDHPLNEVIGEVAEQHDVVFAAGNCGQFCPNSRCGARNIGPGHSILGANAHPDVLTVGAVRTDGLWLGYSSQGPGTLDPKIIKPDICAPSQFAEDFDDSMGNTGTSAASALATGIVARYRAAAGTRMSSAALRQEIIKDAGGLKGDIDQSRFGHGLIRWRP